MMTEEGRPSEQSQFYSKIHLVFTCKIKSQNHVDLTYKKKKICSTSRRSSQLTINESINEVLFIVLKTNLPVLLGRSTSLLSRKAGVCFRGGGKGECGRGCDCTYDVIDLQNTTHSLGGQLKGAGRNKQWLKNVLFQNISNSALK